MDTTPAAAQKRPSALAAIALAADGLLACELIIIAILAALLAAPRLAGYEPFIAESQSMYPALAAGDLEYVDTRDTDVREGDIIAFPIGSGEICVHRAIAVDADGMVTTKGDANEAADPSRVAPGDVYGTVALSIPGAGIPAAWAVENAGAIACAVAATFAAAAAASAAERRMRARKAPAPPVVNPLG